MHNVSIQVGEARVTALSDTREEYVALEVYPGASRDDLEQYGDIVRDGRLLLNFASYLIRAGGRIVLVDTGWGSGHNGRLPEALAEASVGPDQVDAVVFTHLHGDHIGWTLVEEAGGPRPRFPRARYLAPRADWAHYTSIPEPSRLFREQMLPLEGMGVLELIEGGYRVAPGVEAVATPGHTPGHLSFSIESGGERALILGDVCISPIDVEHADLQNRFDGDSELARRTRHAVLQQMQEDGRVVAAGHFPHPGFGRIVAGGVGRTWRAEGAE